MTAPSTDGVTTTVTAVTDNAISFSWTPAVGATSYEIKSRYENIDIIYQTILEINQDIKWLEAKTGISSEQSFVSTIEVENTKKYVDAIDLEEDKCYSSKERKKSKMKAK